MCEKLIYLYFSERTAFDCVQRLEKFPNCYPIVSTGCPDQIRRNFKITLLHNQKTCRKCKDSFGIMRNRAIK